MCCRQKRVFARCAWRRYADARACLCRYTLFARHARGVMLRALSAMFTNGRQDARRCCRYFLLPLIFSRRFYVIFTLD